MLGLYKYAYLEPKEREDSSYLSYLHILLSDTVAQLSYRVYRSTSLSISAHTYMTTYRTSYTVYTRTPHTPHTPHQGRRSRGGPGVLTPPLFVSVGVHMHMDPPTFFYSKVHFFSQHYISRCQYLSHLMLNCTNQITNSRSDHNLAIATSARSAPMQWHATRPPEVQSSDSGNNYSHGLSSLPCHS